MKIGTVIRPNVLIYLGQFLERSYGSLQFWKEEVIKQKTFILCCLLILSITYTECS